MRLLVALLEKYMLIVVCVCVCVDGKDEDEVHHDTALRKSDEVAPSLPVGAVPLVARCHPHRHLHSQVERLVPYYLRDRKDGYQGRTVPP